MRVLGAGPALDICGTPPRFFSLNSIDFLSCLRYITTPSVT